jgi:hypothetical protein
MKKFVCENVVDYDKMVYACLEQGKVVSIDLKKAFSKCFLMS